MDVLLHWVVSVKQSRGWDKIRYNLNIVEHAFDLHNIECDSFTDSSGEFRV